MVFSHGALQNIRVIAGYYSHISMERLSQLSQEAKRLLLAKALRELFPEEPGE